MAVPHVKTPDCYRHGTRLAEVLEECNASGYFTLKTADIALIGSIAEKGRDTCGEEMNSWGESDPHAPADVKPFFREFLSPFSGCTRSDCPYLINEAGSHDFQVPLVFCQFELAKDSDEGWASRAISQLQQLAIGTTDLSYFLNMELTVFAVNISIQQSRVTIYALSLDELEVLEVGVSE